MGMEELTAVRARALADMLKAWLFHKDMCFDKRLVILVMEQGCGIRIEHFNMNLV